MMIVKPGQRGRLVPDFRQFAVMSLSGPIGWLGGRVIWFQDTPDGASTRLMLKTFGDQDKHRRGHVTELADCDVADTFRAFADQPGIAGFSFLQRRMQSCSTYPKNCQHSDSSAGGNSSSRRCRLCRIIELDDVAGNPPDGGGLAASPRPENQRRGKGR